MKCIVVIFLLSLFCGCGKKTSNLPGNQYGEFIGFDMKTVKFLPTDEMLESKSYSTSCALSVDSIDRVIGYNRFVHALDILMIYDDTSKLSSISLKREGPDGIPGRICGMYAAAEDSIWVYDGVRMYLLDNKGHVKYKTQLPGRECVEIRTNYAMNTSKFVYNDKHNSLLYLACRDDAWVVEEYQLNMNEVINVYPLSFSLYNNDNKGFYGNKKAPNVNFSSNFIIYNYPYESSIYTLDTITGIINSYGGQSQYTMNVAEECHSKNDYSAWERHSVENPHFYEVSCLSELGIYVRLHLKEKSYEPDMSFQELIDGKTLYAMCFDEEFNIIGEVELKKQRYSYFTGWCALSNSMLYFVDNSLSEEVDGEELIVDLMFPNPLKSGIEKGEKEPNRK